MEAKQTINILFKVIDTDLFIYTNTTQYINFDFRLQLIYNIFFTFWGLFSTSHFSSFENKFISEYIFRSIFFKIFISEFFSLSLD